MRLGAWWIVLFGGCASVQATGARPPAPAAPLPVGFAEGADPGGDADFRAIAYRAQTDPRSARAPLQAFLAHHPHHAQRPVAVAMLTAILLDQGDAAAAKTVLGENAGMLAAPDRDILDGVAESQLGRHARALALLGKYVNLDPPRMAGLPDPQVKLLLRAALSETLLATGDPAGAIDQLELYSRVDGLGALERTFARRRAEEIASGTSDQVALDALAGRHGVLAQAVLGEGAVRALRGRGDETRAAALAGSTAGARMQLGLGVDLPSAITGDPTRLGLLVPLSGPQARLGEVILRGAMLVVTGAEHAAEPAPYRILPRDSAAPPERSAKGGGPLAGLSALAREERIIGAVAVSDARSVELATRDGLPLLLLDERAPGAHSTAFQIIHPSEARAAALAQQALDLGSRKFAVLGPDSPSGKRLTAAFRQAVESGGGGVMGEITYAPGTTTFSTEVQRLRRLAFDALFVPDDAGRLELIAPALAVADIWSRPPRSFSPSARETHTSGSGRRDVLLLSTALGLGTKFVHNAERYVQGALLCPGFYPADDARGGNFVSRFEEAYGTLPSATDAYGYDAVLLLRTAVERGARTRADVLRVLGSQTFEGVTGDIRFGPGHNRIDTPHVYVVAGESIRLLK